MEFGGLKEEREGGGAVLEHATANGTVPAPRPGRRIVLSELRAAGEQLFINFPMLT